MPRVALYARYSDDKQSPASIDDQFLICREQAAREGWRIVANYKDAAISGASVILRPGIQSLLHDAQIGRRPFTFLIRDRASSSSVIRSCTSLWRRTIRRPTSIRACSS